VICLSAQVHALLSHLHNLYYCQCHAATCYHFKSSACCTASVLLSVVVLAPTLLMQHGLHLHLIVLQLATVARSCSCFATVQSQNRLHFNILVKCDTSYHYKLSYAVDASAFIVRIETASHIICTTAALCICVHAHSTQASMSMSRMTQSS
jgi:hypothetical protein